MSETRKPDATLPPSPGQTVGPFFHFGLMYAKANELVDASTPGAIRLEGTVRDGNGDPVPDALIEIWQARPDGTVVESSGHIARDGTFTGFGRAATDAEGHYWFRTLTPGVMEGQTAAFFAVTVFARGLLHRLFTRAYLPKTTAKSDPLLAALEPDRRSTLLTQADPQGNLAFDIVLQGDNETVFLDFDSAGGA